MTKCKKFCKDCMWHIHSDTGCEGELDKCCAPQNIVKQREESVYCVVGKLPEEQNRWRYQFCTMQREDGWYSARAYHTCGREGRWWKMKDAYYAEKNKR